MESIHRVRVMYWSGAHDEWRTVPGDKPFHPRYFVPLNWLYHLFAFPAESADDVAGALAEARVYGDAGPRRADCELELLDSLIDAAKRNGAIRDAETLESIHEIVSSRQRVNQ